MKKKIIIVVVAVLIVVLLLFSFVGIRNYLGNKEMLAEAQRLFDSGKYESAIEYLDMKRIENSNIEKKANKAKIEKVYNAAIELMDKDSYEEALELFNLFDDSYKDVKEKVKECENACKESLYLNAVEVFEKDTNNIISDSLLVFRNLKGYKDSSEYIAKILNKYPEYAEDGEYLYFGTYEQDGDLENGAEPLKWYVRVIQEETAILYCTDVIEVMPYNAGGNQTNWYETTLKNWLNNDFYTSSFTTEEKEKIYELKDRSANGVMNSHKIKLPSSLMKDITFGISKYAASKGVEKKNGNISYWVLSGDLDKSFAIVDGVEQEIKSNSDNIGVIPSMVVLRNYSTVKKCEDCGNYYNRKEGACNFCFSESKKIAKEYFTNTKGKVTDICTEDGCDNYIAYSGRTTYCSGHANHCSECDIYIDRGSAKCSECIAFTNKYGSRGTKCAVSGCKSNVSSSGDTNCCEYHSARCLECKQYIDSDAMYCMSCIKESLGK